MTPPSAISAGEFQWDHGVVERIDTALLTAAAAGPPDMGEAGSR